MSIVKTIKLPALIIGLVIGLFAPFRLLAQSGYDVPVESFYDELAPYGQWQQYPGYGQVWLPNAGPDFQPYASNGHWVMTEYGNTWVSDYDWGWAPFHYGRWTFDPAYGGWLWLPGQEWAPAWVSWRSGGGYYGWAPLGPGANVNVNINIPAPYWTFVPQVYFNQPNWRSYCVARPRVVNIYQQTTIINNYYRGNNWAYAVGPNRYDIERVTRQPVQVYRVETVNRPGRALVNNGAVGFYRPGSAANGRADYRRNDQYTAPNRPDYNRNNSPGRGYYEGQTGSSEQSYNRNAGPERTYDGASNGNGRGSYEPSPGANAPQRNQFESSRGNYAPGNTPQETTAPQAVPAPNRSEMNRGNYSPNGISQPGNTTQQGRSYNRAERQGRFGAAPSAPGARAGGNAEPESRQQQRQAQPQRENNGSFGGEHRSRGPR